MKYKQETFEKISLYVIARRFLPKQSVFFTELTRLLRRFAPRNDSYIFVYTFLLLCILCFSLSGVALGQDKKEVSFSKDLFPLLKAKCLKCHEQDDENPNNFAMETYDLLIKGGKTKNMVVPGKSSESYLIVKLLPNPPKGAQMPIFSKKKLGEDEVDLIRRWIDQGAKNN